MVVIFSLSYHRKIYEDMYKIVLKNLCVCFWLQQVAPPWISNILPEEVTIIPVLVPFSLFYHRKVLKLCVELGQIFLHMFRWFSLIVNIFWRNLSLCFLYNFLDFLFFCWQSAARAATETRILLQASLTADGSRIRQNYSFLEVSWSKLTCFYSICKWEKQKFKREVKVSMTLN